MALTESTAAAMVHAQLDNLAIDLTPTASTGLPAGDYTYPLQFALRDMGLSAISSATSMAQERAVLKGMEYYAYLRLVRKFTSRASSQQGSGAAALHLQIDWASTAKTLRSLLMDAKESYEGALSAIGASMSSDPALGVTTSQAVVVDPEREIGAVLVDSSMGMPWFVESVYG
jgi:hypothetical protein